jgi:hypothetical protein
VQFYLAGVAIYPWNISTYAVNALLTQAEPWDKMGSSRETVVLRRTHDISPLICHVPDRGNVHFKTHKDLERQIPETAVIFHKCKDGSLLDVLQNKEGTSDELEAEGAKPSATERREVVGALSFVHRADQVSVRLFHVPDTAALDLLLQLLDCGAHGQQVSVHAAAPASHL